MTHAFTAAQLLDGPGPCRGASRIVSYLRRQGSDGAPRSWLARHLHRGDEHVRRPLSQLLDLGLIEVVPTSRFGSRWRVRQSA